MLSLIVGIEYDQTSKVSETALSFRPPANAAVAAVMATSSARTVIDARRVSVFLRMLPPQGLRPAGRGATTSWERRRIAGVRVTHRLTPSAPHRTRCHAVCNSKH